MVHRSSPPSRIFIARIFLMSIPPYASLLSSWEFLPPLVVFISFELFENTKNVSNYQKVLRINFLYLYYSTEKMFVKGFLKKN